MKKFLTSLTSLTFAAVLCVNSVFADVPCVGDTDLDGVVTASDAALIMQKVLSDGIKMPIEQTRSFMYIADADGDDMLTASDAASVMQKVLYPEYSLENEKKTYKQWLERKGADKTELFKKEVDNAAAVYSAAFTYAVDLYTQGKWDSDVKITFPMLIHEGLLNDETKYYKYRIYINTKQGTADLIDRVEWDTQNSPYGTKGIYPRDGHADELETQWGWFEEKRKILPYYMYSVASDYLQMLKNTGNWSDDTVISVKDMVQKGYLRYYPIEDYTIVTENGSVKYVQWNTEDGRTLKYPQENITDELIDYMDMYEQAKKVFAAAQTYATDLYTQAKWTGEKYINAEDLVYEGLLDNYPSYRFTIETTGEKNTPAVKQVIYEEGGKKFRYPSDGKSDTVVKGINGASTVFSAAQTYATDLYTQGKWSGKLQITTDDLVSAGLLTKRPDTEFVIVTAGEDLTPAIHHVEFLDDEGYTCTYPGTPSPYPESLDSPALVYNAAQTYLTDLFVQGKWSEGTKVTLDDLLREYWLCERPDKEYTIYTSENSPAVIDVEWTDENGKVQRYPEGAYYTWKVVADKRKY